MVPQSQANREGTGEVGEGRLTLLAGPAGPSAELGTVPSCREGGLAAFFLSPD